VEYKIERLEYIKEKINFEVSWLLLFQKIFLLALNILLKEQINDALSQ
jgi:hypothetical protein